MGYKFGAATLALAMLFGVFAASTVQAQRRDDRDWRRDRDYDNDRDWRRNGNRDGRYDPYGRNSNSNYELNRGYQQGLNTGASDAQRGQSYSPQRSHYYRNPSSAAFRDGFVRGYDQGYRQYAGYNNDRYGNGNGRYGNDRYGNGRNGNGGYGRSGDRYELDRGYQQGLETGASDGQRGQSYNPERSRYYRNASTQAFREGFVRGYDEGYRRYARGGYRRNTGGITDILGGILGIP